jgi:uncharacterized protein YbaR (Trm112 family)
MPDIVFNCPNCRTPLKVESTAAGQEAECPDCKTTLTIPAAGDAQHPTPKQTPPPPVPRPTIPAPAATVAPGRSTSGYAVAGLVLGILSIVPGLMCGGPLLAILGIVFSSVAQSRIRRTPARWGGRGLAIAGLVTSIVGLAVSIATIAWLGAVIAAMETMLKSMGIPVPH